MAIEQSEPSEPIEGLDGSADFGDYPLDSLMIRTDTRTIYDVVVRRIGRGFYVMDPDFQRDFVWTKERQSRLVESVLMRIPLPVFYLAENSDGKLVVVDGLQRLTTFQHFFDGMLELTGVKPELAGKTFNELPAVLQNRIEDTQLTLYIIDSKAPDRARLDIFERVNGGVALTRQQMRNALYQGKATKALKELAAAPMFVKATGGSLDWKTMRDREAINRFCAFYLLRVEGYQSMQADMDGFLGRVLVHMNGMSDAEIEALKGALLRSMRNNFTVFDRYAFRKHDGGRTRKNVFNMALFDVFSTCLAPYDELLVEERKGDLQQGFYALMTQQDFVLGISNSTNSTARVEGRFTAARRMVEGVLGAP